MTYTRRMKIFRAFFIPVFAAFLQIISSCAGSSQLPENMYEGIPAGEYSSRYIDPGIEILTGGHKQDNVSWMAVRSVNAELSVSPVSETSLSRHAGMYFSNPALEAVLTASPHSPVRFRSGLPQSVSGFYRIDGKTISEPDGRHDALGINEKGYPVILSPGEQSGWRSDAAGGFYTILLDGEPLNPVPLRDAVSAAGWSEDGSVIILLVISGGNGKGYSYEEAGSLLCALGARDGIAMDGGGSSRLVWREDGNLHSFPPVLMYRALPNHLLLIK